MIPRESKPRRAYEVMDTVLNRGDAEYLASILSVSPQLIRAWCREHESESANSTGKFGPLDRIRALISMVREDDGGVERAYPIGNYVAGLLDGVFVPLPVLPKDPDSQIMERVSEVMIETGQAIEATRKAWFENSPGRLTIQERSDCLVEIDEAIGAMVSLRRWIESRH